MFKGRWHQPGVPCSLRISVRRCCSGAVICRYALIRMPLGRQPRLLRDAVWWLPPGGWLLATTGQNAWTGTGDRWPGGPAAMWRSHASAVACRSWISQAGLEITSRQHVRGGGRGHALSRARKPATDQAAAAARLRTDRGQ